MIYPVLLSGGTGSRLWPLSRCDSPKQFLSFAGDQPMIVETALRVSGPEFAKPVIIPSVVNTDPYDGPNSFADKARLPFDFAQEGDTGHRSRDATLFGGRIWAIIWVNINAPWYYLGEDYIIRLEDVYKRVPAD